MTLKEWNKLQCNLFKTCNIDVSNIIEVYRVCSMISPLREIDSYEKALELALELLESSTYDDIEKNPVKFRTVETEIQEIGKS